jgi:hypothetical protein
MISALLDPLDAGDRLSSYIDLPKRLGYPASNPVNGDGTESFRNQSVVKEELIHSIKEMLAIYIHLRQTLIGRSAAGCSSLQQQLLQ